MASLRARGRLILFLVLLLTVPTISARAAEVLTDCADLQAALDAASDGDVITITQATCTGMSFTMATGIEITLQGAPGTGTTLDGTGAPARLLSGLDVEGSIFRNLTFRNGAAASVGGGGAAITGTVFPTFENVVFDDNGGEEGGGLLVSSTAAAGTIRIADSTFENNLALRGGGLAIIAAQAPNVAAVIESSSFSENNAFSEGGGAWIAVRDITLDSNRFDSNEVGERGGGASVIVENGEADIRDNVFVGNGIDPAAVTVGSDYYGGGLHLGVTSGTSANQVGNVFDGNYIGSLISVAVSGSSAHGGYGPDVGVGGAGEFVRELPNGTGPLGELFTNRDRFINNTVRDPEPGVEVDGGGFGARTVEVIGWNTVAAGNRVLGAMSEGAGLYFGGSTFGLVNATVSGNTAVSGTAGIGGDVGDILNLDNSIVAGNTGTTPDIFGFSVVNAQFSDSCTGIGLTGGPFPGTGNICADPLLVNPAPGTADVHQTATSPTRDAGSNALVPAALTTDYEGDDRIMDSNADGVEVVDMGADELLQPLIIQPQPAAPPLQQAAAPPGGIPATGPEDLVPQSLAAVSYVLLGIFLLRVTTPKWQAAWRATSYGARHSGQRRGRYVPRHRGGRRTL